MTLIKELNDWIDESLKTVPKVSKDSLILHVVKNKLKELAKKELEINDRYALGHAYIYDLEEVVEDG